LGSYFRNIVDDSCHKTCPGDYPYHFESTDTIPVLEVDYVDWKCLDECPEDYSTVENRGTTKTPKYFCVNECTAKSEVDYEGTCTKVIKSTSKRYCDTARDEDGKKIDSHCSECFDTERARCAVCDKGYMLNMKTVDLDREEKATGEVAVTHTHVRDCVKECPTGTIKYEPEYSELDVTICQGPKDADWNEVLSFVLVIVYTAFFFYWLSRSLGEAKVRIQNEKEDQLDEDMRREMEKQDRYRDPGDSLDAGEIPPEETLEAKMIKSSGMQLGKVVLSLSF